jgi:hypothetical protein
MSVHKLLMLSVTFLALLVFQASPVLAELKNSYTASGNNCGLVLKSYSWGGPLQSSLHQFPAESGNYYQAGRWNWGVNVARDNDGDGVAEDTAVVQHRANNVFGQNNSLESFEQITVLAMTEDSMDQAAGSLEVNPLYVSTDAEDLGNWPPEFR